MKVFHLLSCCMLLVPLAGCTAAGRTDPCRAQPDAECAKKPEVPRRAVPRLPERPTPAAPAPQSAAPAATPPVHAPPPSPNVGVCDPGGCWDTGGNRYNGGTGSVYLDRNGRQCQRNGTSMQCF